MAGIGQLPVPGNAYAQVQNPVVVVGPQFVAPYPIDLVLSKKLFKLGEGHFDVTDVNGTLIFSLQNKFFSIRDRRTLFDAYGSPLLTLQQKILTAHRRWQVYRGESTNPKDLIFSAKKSSLLQFKTELNVFLAGNSSESDYDFKVRGSWLERSCTIHLGASNTIIGQMHKKHSIESIIFDKDTFAVTAYPYVDYAFIMALVIILYEINEDRNGND